MITITDSATEKIKKILSVEGKPTWGLRVYIEEGGCCGPSYGMDLDENPGKDDEIIEKNGLRVFMDKKTFAQLKDMEIDFINDGEQSGFVLKGGPSACDSGCSTCG